MVNLQVGKAHLYALTFVTRPQNSFGARQPARDVPGAFVGIAENVAYWRVEAALIFGAQRTEVTHRQTRQPEMDLRSTRPICLGFSISERVNAISEGLTSIGAKGSYVKVSRSNAYDKMLFGSKLALRVFLILIAKAKLSRNR
jgi:hypothetical protein